MPNIKTNTSIVISLLRAKRVPFLRGRPGTGKSAVAYQAAATLSLSPVVLMAPDMVPEDASGLPMADADKAYATFKRMEWAHRVATSPCLLVVEELPAALPTVRKALAPWFEQSAYTKGLLHEQSRVIVTGNRPEDAAGSEHLESHLISRLGVIEFDSSVADLETWWMKSRLCPSFPAFWRWSPDSFNTFNPKDKSAPYACPRSWQALADCLSQSPDMDEATMAGVAESLVGRVAPAYIGFRRLALSQSPDEWLNNPATPLPSGEKLYALAVALPPRAIERGKETQAIAVACGMPPELGTILVKALIGRSAPEKQKALLASPEYKKFRDANLACMKG